MTGTGQTTVTLPVALVARAILALDRDLFGRPMRDEKVPGVPHECEPEDSDESCDLLHDQWVTNVGPHPVAQALRDALAASADASRPTPASPDGGESRG